MYKERSRVYTVKHSLFIGMHITTFITFTKGRFIFDVPRFRVILSRFCQTSAQGINDNGKWHRIKQCSVVLTQLNSTTHQICWGKLFVFHLPRQNVTTSNTRRLKVLHGYDSRTGQFTTKLYYYYYNHILLLVYSIYYILLNHFKQTHGKHLYNIYIFLPITQNFPNGFRC